MFAVIRHYHFRPEDGPAIDRAIQNEFVPLIKKAKGFIRYYWLDTGGGEGASFGLFRDKAGADESIEIAADYVNVAYERTVKSDVKFRFVIDISTI